MHSELDRVEFWKGLEKTLQRRLCIRGQVVGRYAPNQPGHSFAGIRRGSRNAPALHTTAMDVIPNARCDFNTSLVSDGQHLLESRRILRLLLGRYSHEFDPGETRSIEEVRIRRSHEAPVLIAEDHDKAVDAALRQQVEVTRPIVLVIQTLLEVSALHRVRGHTSHLQIRS